MKKAIIFQSVNIPLEYWTLFFVTIIQINDQCAFKNVNCTPFS